MPKIKMTTKLSVIGMNVLLVYASEDLEMTILGFEITHDMPDHMQKQLAKNAKKEMCSYEISGFDDGVNGLDGLVDTEECRGYEVEEIESYIEDVLSNPDKRRSVIGMRADFVITLGAL
jgi:hypothetical protein